MSIQEIDVRALAEKRKTNQPHLLLDVREAAELSTAAIPGALHIPMKHVPERLGEIATDLPVIVMCHHGGRSERITRYLQEQGRSNVYNLKGGIDEWAVQIDPSVARY